MINGLENLTIKLSKFATRQHFENSGILLALELSSTDLAIAEYIIFTKKQKNKIPYEYLEILGVDRLSRNKKISKQHTVRAPL